MATQLSAEKCVTGLDIEDEKQMEEVKRRVMNEEYCCTLDKLVELTRVTSRYLCHLSKRFKRHDEGNEKEMSSAKMDENQGRFHWMCLVPKHSDQVPVPGYSDQEMEVRVL